MDDLMLLHGFAGTSRAWDPVVSALGGPTYKAVDLRGHGSASSVRPVSFAGCTEDVLAAAPPRFALAGYSLGGRIALHVALAAPERVTRLVLIATTAGIADDAERAARRAADDALAAQAEATTIERFAALWAAQPLFAGTPPQAAAWWREDILRNDVAGLAAALRGIGTGAMTPLWDRLGELTMPADVVVGERDAKFVALGERLAAGLGGPVRTHVVPGAGHGLPREAPEELAHILQLPHNRGQTLQSRGV
jgi:2-succinyl-6-hydroxy-2,4-cyclohexadiene-1-carboxylate synthase